MNIIEKWARLVQESINPDDYKSDKMDHDGDKWEELQKSIDEINKKLEKKSIKEADEDDDEEGEPFSDDPEFKNTLDKTDDFMNSIDKTNDRNEKLANGEGSEADKDNLGKMFFVFELVDEYEFTNSKVSIENAIKNDDIGSLKPGKSILNVNRTEKFFTEESAKKFVDDEIRKYSDKYGVKPEDFKKMHDKVEINYSFTSKEIDDNGKRKTSKKKVEVGAIPKDILKLDPNAIGFIYVSFSTDGDGKVYGIDKGGVFTKDDTEENSNEVIMEFICYKSTQPAPANGGMMELDEMLRRLNDPNYKTTEEKRREFEHQMSELEDEIFESTADAIEKFIATQDDEVILKVIKPYFQGKDDDYVLNLTADDLKNFGKQKVFNIRNGIWRYRDENENNTNVANLKSEKRSVTQDIMDFVSSESKENVSKVLKQYFSGKSEDDLKNLSSEDIDKLDDDTKLKIRGKIWKFKSGEYIEDPSDIAKYIADFVKNEKEEYVKSILKPYFKDTPEDELKDITQDDLMKLDQSKLESLRNKIQKFKDGESIEDIKSDDDGEDSDSDEGGSGDDSAENSNGNDTRNDDDLDDYESSQNNTGASYSNKEQNSKEDAKMTMHGVKISKKVWDTIKTMPRDKMPKNAEEVKKLTKEINDRDK